MKAFVRKEWMELCRSGRLLMLVMVFSLFGIMNPAVAKLTPWLMETFLASMGDMGAAAAAIEIDALTSWMQFYKNIPAGLIIFLLICSGSFPTEYQTGTLILVVTKGLSRRKILLAKLLTLSALWTVLYWLCFGITYGYNAYFWDNGIAEHLLYAGASAWLFGILAAALLLFFSAAAQSAPQVLLGTGGVVMGMYLLRIVPKLDAFLPVKLMEGMPLLSGTDTPADYAAGTVTAVVMILLCIILAAACFDRKRL